MKELTNEEIGALCMSLAGLFHAGIGTGDALTLMAQDEEEPAFRRLLTDMAAAADEGAPLSAVFRRSGCMPDYVCGLLDVGEQAGRTEQTLEALGQHYDSRGRMEQQLRAALLYPSVLLAVMLAVVLVLLMWVLPVFDDVYAQLGSRLTGVAGGLLALGTALRQATPLLGGLLGAGLAALAAVCCVPRLRTAVVSAVRKVWGDRGAAGKIRTARVAQALSLGLCSGMTHPEAMELALTLAPEDMPIRKRCQECLNALESGGTLAAALGKAGLLSAAQCRLLDAGMRSGRGEQVMAQIAQRQLEEGETALEAAVSRIEPTLVVITSALVGVILLTVMLPLMHIMTGIG